MTTEMKAPTADTRGRERGEKIKGKPFKTHAPWRSQGAYQCASERVFGIQMELRSPETERAGDGEEDDEDADDEDGGGGDEEDGDDEDDDCEVFI